MTDHGICHLAFGVSALTLSDTATLKPKCARTLTNWTEDWSDWHETLRVCRALASVGVHNLILFNTQASGTILKDISLQQVRLDRFLRLARDEYSYVDPYTGNTKSPVHSVEPINEADTPGWNDGSGKPITPQLCADVAHAHHTVAETYGVEVIGPSFLGGPSSEMVKGTAQLLDRAGLIKTFAIHTYGRSISGQPWEGGIWGDLKTGIEELHQWCPNMQIDVTEVGWWTVDGDQGEDGQKRYVEAFCQFQHPVVRRMYLFCLDDWMPTTEEFAIGKDFGLRTRSGILKPAWHAFNGGLTLVTGGNAMAIPEACFKDGWGDKAPFSDALGICRVWKRDVQRFGMAMGTEHRGSDGHVYQMFTKGIGRWVKDKGLEWSTDSGKTWMFIGS